MYCKIVVKSFDAECGGVKKLNMSTSKKQEAKHVCFLK